MIAAAVVATALMTAWNHFEIVLLSSTCPGTQGAGLCIDLDGQTYTIRVYA